MLPSFEADSQSGPAYVESLVSGYLVDFDHFHPEEKTKIYERVWASIWNYKDRWRIDGLSITDEILYRFHFQERFGLPDVFSNKLLEILSMEDEIFAETTLHEAIYKIISKPVDRVVGQFRWENVGYVDVDRNKVSLSSMNPGEINSLGLENQLKIVGEICDEMSIKLDKYSLDLYSVAVRIPTLYKDGYVHQFPQIFLNTQFYAETGMLEYFMQITGYADVDEYFEDVDKGNLLTAMRDMALRVVSSHR